MACSASSTASPMDRPASGRRSSTETRKKKSELDNRRLEAEAAGGGAGGVDAGRSRFLSEPTDVDNHEGGHHLLGAVGSDPDQSSEADDGHCQRIGRPGQRGERRDRKSTRL